MEEIERMIEEINEIGRMLIQISEKLFQIQEILKKTLKKILIQAK